MSTIKLVALDLDGTLFNNESMITKENLSAIREIVKHGVHVVISTGRPFMGLPFDQLKDSGIRYAITTNGSAVYEIPTQTCLYEDSMDADFIVPILNFLLTKDIHMDAFIQGKGFSPKSCVSAAQKLSCPPSLKKYILDTRIRVDNLAEYIVEHQLRVQKMTLNFYPDENGVFVDREAIRQYLEALPTVNCVCGGYHNLEFTKAGIDKGVGLARLAQILSVPMTDTMAIGDSENDLSILKAAGLGIAMANAAEEIKAIADDITLSNEEDGVAAAIRKYIHFN